MWGKQKLVTAFSSIHGHKPGVRSLNAVVDWQQQCGYLVYGSSLNMLWNMGCLPLPYQCSKIEL
jgi:regulator-associated protein of mTOR